MVFETIKSPPLVNLDWSHVWIMSIWCCDDYTCVYSSFHGFCQLFSPVFMIWCFYVGVGSSGQYGSTSRGGWALPSTDRIQNSGRVMRDSRAQNSGRVMPDGRAQNSGRVIPDGREAGSYHADLSGRMKSDAGDRTSYSRGKGRNWVTQRAYVAGTCSSLPLSPAFPLPHLSPLFPRWSSMRPIVSLYCRLLYASYAK